MNRKNNRTRSGGSPGKDLSYKKEKGSVKKAIICMKKVVPLT